MAAPGIGFRIREQKITVVSSCIQQVYDKLPQYMTTMIEGLRLYAAEKPEGEVAEKIELAINLM